MAYPQTIFVNTTVAPASLLGRRREAVAVATLLYQLQVLKETGRYEAFKLTWHPSYSDPPDVPPVPNHLFWDSDIAKWIEGACYFLASGNEVPEVREAVQELVEMIGSAQQSDGYINIHYTVVEPGRRWTNLRDMHELYNAGHLIEAALAHRSLFKNDLLLGPLRKYADLLCAVFGPGMAQIHGYPGHPEIELALLRLFEHTKEERYRSLAKYFLIERGNPTGCQGRHFYDVEAERRGADPQRRPLPWPEDRCLWYQQAHLPISLQPTIEGHSVRAMYLLTAVADLVRMEQPEPTTSTVELKVAMHRLWDNMVERKMYVTGGIGAIKQWEGFGVDYFLPQGTDDGGCYAETCAAIGVMMLAERILQGTSIDIRVPVTEQHITADETTGDSYVRLELQNGARDVKDVAQDKARNSPFVDASGLFDSARNQKALESLNFIPYYFRANRGGTGQMRVGLRAWQH
ncbi:hypothetical protein LTR56_003697 [Elasticomyces elasticus]|nr:hypothetical protein LTR22_016924 [Elasticomyces elasticus]KAK3655275.1 hypothetical protein LTR56_003697 [Elasticomyces elasticus]KAK4913554.1 hypothetical protein LTR49_018170 [Elasticomyces elasticus]KAK5736585.1 hypothetical protein LTS12_026148 [Elasticomyces elasticus]